MDRAEYKDSAAVTGVPSDSKDIALSGCEGRKDSHGRVAQGA